jgi:hypothetical protein
MRTGYGKENGSHVTGKPRAVLQRKVTPFQTIIHYQS